MEKLKKSFRRLSSLKIDKGKLLVRVGRKAMNHLFNMIARLPKFSFPFIIYFTFPIP